MSETTEETTTETTEPAVEPVEPTEPEAPLEPDEPLEPAAEPIEHDDADQPEEGTLPPAEPTEPQGLSEKDYIVREQKLDNENLRHAKRVSEIMEEASTDLIPCPVCMDGIAGWVYLPEVAQLPPEAITRIRQLIRLPDLTTYQPAPFAMQCPDCAGMGEVTTGSLVNGYEVTTCETCQKTGWVRKGQPAKNGHVTIEAPTITGPTVYGTEETSDPEIAHLRERGFTVIPPMKVPNN